MGQAIAITRNGHPAGELRKLAGASDDAEVVRRLLALAMVLDGCSRTEAACNNGMDRQTLRDWVHRYNAEGIDGLTSRKSRGRPPVLTKEQMQELKAVVIEGPDLEKHKVVRWRCCDLREEIASRYEIKVHERTVGKLLRRIGLTRLQPRPSHPNKDPAAQEAFKKTFADIITSALPETAAGKPIEIWFSDEARVGQKGTLTYVWAPVGSRPAMVRDNRHDSAYLFGAICPARAVGAAVIMPSANAEAMNEHLTEISSQVSLNAHAALLLDQAGWHQTGGRLEVPGNLTLVPLPPYSPELNSMENVWEYLRGNKLCRLVWDNYDAILSACKEAWNFFIGDPDRIRSIGTRQWACVNV